MGEPAVVNGAPITMTRGSSTKSSTFSNGSPKVKAGGYPVVIATSLLGGLTFVASLTTTKTKVGGQLVPLVTATVTDSAGYTGTISPAQGAGLKFDFA